MPHKERIQKWVDALRSGDYVQGKNVLRKPGNKFCCMGVLCDISGQGEWLNLTNDIDNNKYYLFEDKDGSTLHAIPTISPSNWLGLSSPISSIYFNNHKLQDWNDQYDASFEDIADMIEAKWLAK